MDNINLQNIPQMPDSQTPVDLPTASLPETTPVAAPSVTPQIAPLPDAAPTPMTLQELPVAPPETPIQTGIRSAGFFSAKIITSLAVVVVLGGGVAFGYFVFPEPFYNTVGKYLGLPAPDSSTTTEDLRAVADDADFGVVSTSDEEKTEEETGNTETDTTALESDVNIFDVIPGEDANFLLSFKVSENSLKIVQDLIIKNKNGTSTATVPEEDLALVKSVSQVVFAAKFIAGTTTKTMETLNAAAFPMVLGIKTTPEFEQKLLERIKIQTQTDTKYQYDLSSTGNGVVIAKTLGYELSGKFSDNPMFSTIESADSDFVLAGDLSDFANQAAQEEEKMSPEELAKNPIKAKQLALQKKMKNGAVLANFIENNLELNVNIQMEDSAAAAEFIAFLTPTMEQFKMLFMPPEYQQFLELELNATEEIATINIMIKDLAALEQKINEATKANLKNREYLPIPSVDTYENTGTETMDAPPAAPSGDRVKVPRVKAQ